MAVPSSLPNNRGARSKRNGESSGVKSDKFNTTAGTKLHAK